MKKRNRILAFILAVIMIMTALPLSALADELDDAYLPEVEQEIVVPEEDELSEEEDAEIEYEDECYVYDEDMQGETDQKVIQSGNDAASFDALAEWIVIDNPNGNLTARVEAVLADYGLAYISEVQRLKITGNMTVGIGTQDTMQLRTYFRDTLVELDISGVIVSQIGGQWLGSIQGMTALENVIMPPMGSISFGNDFFENCSALRTVIFTGEVNNLRQNMFRGATSIESLTFMHETAPTVNFMLLLAGDNANQTSRLVDRSNFAVYVPNPSTGGFQEGSFFRQRVTGNVRSIPMLPATPEQRQELADAIAEAEAFSGRENQFTPETWVDLQSALSIARDAFADEKESEGIVVGATSELRNAIENLRYVGNNTYIRVARGATIGVFRKGSRHFAPFERFDLIRDEQRSCDEYDVYAAENLPLNTVLHIEASIPGKTVKYARLFRLPTHGTVMTVNLTPLSEWIPVDNEHRNANFYSNLDDTGTINIAPGGEFVLDMFRVWQTITSHTENYFIEPDFTIEVLGDADSVRVERIGSPGRERFSIVGVRPGVAVLKVTYDPLEFTQLNGTTRRYNAIDPRNTGAIVVTVGGSGNFDTGITARNDYDTYYFDNTAGYHAFTFTPAAGSTVRVHDPLNISSWGSGWTNYSTNPDGSFTVRLKDGRNILEVTNGGAVRYHVVKARGVNVVVLNTTNPGQPFEVGNTLRISIRGIESPVEKVTGIYNPGFNDPQGSNLATFLRYTDGNQFVDSNRSGQYTMLTHNFIFEYTINAPGEHILTGQIYAGMMGSDLNAHRNIPSDGVPANFNAVGRGPFAFGALPVITIAVGDTPDQLEYVTEMYNALRHLRAFITNPTVGNEWAVLALARAGINDDGWYERYIGNLNEAIAAGIISPEWNTHVGITLALTALGYDAANFNGHDMTAAFRAYIPFAERPAWSRTVNADIFALIALDSGNYDGDRDQFISKILAEEKQNSGWGFDPVEADVDLTAMAIQALAPYYSGSVVRAAVDRGVAWLSAQDITSAESNAQVIVALSALGIDAENYVSRLFRYYDNAEGAFRWGNVVNIISTEQAAYALVAHDRFINNDNSLYDMSDAAMPRTRILSVNKAALDIEIGLARGHLRSNFTEDSWALMYAALERAEEVVVQSSPAQTEVDIARDALRTALAGLVRVNTGGGSIGGSRPTVSISVRDDNARPGQTRIFLAETFFEIEPGVDTVFDVLRRTGLSIRYSGRSNYGVYVEAINGFGEFDDGELSGWMYRVNGVFPRRSSGDYILHGGERIEWLFTRDLGRDLEDPMAGGQTGGTNTAEDEDGIGTEVEAEVTGGVAVADVSEDVINELIADAKAEEASTIIINITNIDDADRIEANFAADSIANIVRNGLNLTLFSDIVELAFSLGSLETIAEAIDMDEDVAISFERLIEYDGSVIIEITVFVGDMPIHSFGGDITISVPFVPAEGITSEDYDLLTVYSSNGGDMQEMPGAKYDAENGVMIFTTNHFSKFVLSEWLSPFEDISRDDWFFRAVRFVYSNDLMEGIDGNAFAPDVRISRGMVVSVLWRNEGSPDDKEGTVFDDVTSEDWYADAVAWASTNGIVNGHGNGLFGAHDEVTREQLAVILYNYANWKGLDTVTDSCINGFNDSVNVSDWANNALAWANSNGFVAGRTLTTIAPQGDVNRAEIASILWMFLG